MVVLIVLIFLTVSEFGVCVDGLEGTDLNRLYFGKVWLS